MEQENVCLTDEQFYFNELNHYTNCLFDTWRRLSNAIFQNKEDENYLRGFAEYCKEYIYYYAEQLTKLKGE